MIFERLQRFQTDEPVTESDCVVPSTVDDDKYDEKVKDYRELFLFNENSKLALAIEEGLHKSGSINAKTPSAGQCNAYALFQR